MLLYSVIFESFTDKTPSPLDAPLRTYIGMTNQETFNGKPYLSGTLNGPTISDCVTTDTKEYGNSWNAVYGITGATLQTNICVPLSYSDPNAYIPCDSSNPGLPNNANCSSDLNQACKDSIDNLRTNMNSFPSSFPSSFPPDDLQQYEHKCIKKCPCMNKYGDTYNGPVGSPYICKYSRINNNCVQSSTGDYNSFAECQQSCPIQPSNQMYSCSNTPDGTSCIADNNGKYSSLADCQQECSNKPVDNQKYSCNFTTNGNKECIIDDNGKYSSLAYCQQECSNKPVDNQKYSCSNTQNGKSCIVDDNGPYSKEECQQECSNKPSNNNISGYSDDIFWSNCQPILLPINENSNNTYNGICKSILSSSKYTNRLDARECSFGQTKVGCSFTSPSKIKYIKNI
jgi:hypothetical protein